MNRGIIIVALVAAAVPLHAGIVLTLNPALSTPTTVGTFAAGTSLSIGVSGTVNLDGPNGQIITNPDGSLNNPPPASCGICWGPGYQYFLPDGTPGGLPYPTVAGGNGHNLFAGGGGNYDSFSGINPPFAPEGKPTTDTTDPGAIRFGAIAGTFVDNPTATDWFLVGFGGTFLVPDGASSFRIVVVDTFYPNNTGSYEVTVDTAPEPSVAWLAFSGIALLGLKHFRARRR
jgi:hypothetical protein